MNHKLTNGLSFSAAILASIMTLSGCQVSAVEEAPSTDVANNETHTSQSTNWINGDDHISVYHHNDRQQTRYVVNGKSFGWQDLTPAQQQRLTEIEKPMRAAQAKINVDEKALNEIARKLSGKAKIIEAEARKYQEVSVKIDKQNVSFNDIAEIADKLEQKVQINEQLMRQTEQEMRALEAQMPQIDQEALEELEERADQLEIALVEIAKQLP